jgi:hypothetical protein
MDDYTSFLSCPITIVALFIVPHFLTLSTKVSYIPTLLGPYKKYSENTISMRSALMNYHALLPMPFCTFIISTVVSPPLNIGYQNGQARFAASAN